MRSVVVGLVLAAGAITSASAASCVVVVDTGARYAAQPVETPELIGKKFKIGRYTAHKRMIFSKPRGTMFNVGYEAYELSGEAGKYVIRHDHNDGTPAIEVISVKGSDPSIKWVRRRGSPDIGSDGDYVIGGPLTSLVLKPTACS